MYALERGRTRARATRPFVCAFAYAYLRLAARACLPRFAYVEYGTAIVYCCSFYYPRVMVARADFTWPIEIYATI